MNLAMPLSVITYVAMHVVMSLQQILKTSANKNETLKERREEVKLWPPIKQDCCFF